MTAYVLIAWLCSSKARACDAAHAKSVLRSAPMNQYVCISSMPRYRRAARDVQIAVSCEQVSPEV